MKILTTVGNKGGIGKTSTALIFAQYLARVKGMKGALIDLDPQANASSTMIPTKQDPAHRSGHMPLPHPDFDPSSPPEDDPDWDGVSSIVDIFVGRDIYPYPTWMENLHCFPSFPSYLEGVKRVHAVDVQEKIINRLKEFMTMLKEHSDYEFIVIDNNPSIGPLTRATLCAATHALVPVQLEVYGYRGAIGMIEMVLQEKLKRPKDDPIDIVGVLPNRVERNNEQGNYLKLLRENLKEIKGTDDWYLPPVYNRVAFARLVSEKANPNCVFDLPNSDPARKETEAWCDIVYQRMFGDTNKKGFSNDK